MTDHNREELRRALIRAEHEWPGNLERRIDAILSVFEQAHAPTDGEREALDDAFDEMHQITEGGCDTRGEDVADMVIALGFRRTVQGEPTDAQLSEIERRVYDEHRGEVAGFAKALIRAGWAAALRVAGGVE